MKFSVFYHTCLRNADPHIDTRKALQVVMEQSSLMMDSGLADHAESVVVGVNGDDFDQGMLSEVVPEKSTILPFGPMALGEFPTLVELWEHSRKHPGELVCYFHTKGVTQPDNPTWIAWRRCMGRVVILNWTDCVEVLSGGKMDSVGAHWVTPKRCAGCWTPHWGGNFWWCTTDYISRLPSPTKIVQTRYDAEVWLTRHGTRPRVHDFATHWPGTQCRSR